MTRIIGAFALVVALGAMIAAGTGAFFSDSETSSNNILTAGAIDLTVDHERQTYNGDDCETCSLTLYSADENTMVVDSSDNASLQEGDLPIPAPLTTPHPAWTTHATAKWVWATEETTANDAGGTGEDVSYTFERTFNWWGDAVDLTLALDIGADNEYALYLNGVSVAADSGSNYDSIDTLDAGEKTAFKNALETGENTLTIVVTNKYNTQYPNSNNPANNPGGLLYYLTIERDQEDCNENTTFQEMCRLWTAKDLEKGDTFYTFDDIKPGDWGTNLISLHVLSNNAHTCLVTHNVESTDETCVDPEVEAEGDGVCVETDGDGELDDGLEVAAWIDTDMNGEYDGEDIVWEGMLADLTADMNVDGNDTLYLGTVWCAGDLVITEGTSGYDCDADGFVPGNAAQTDKLMMDLTAWAEQARHNDGFSCDEVRNMLEAEQDA